MQMIWTVRERSAQISDRAWPEPKAQNLVQNKSVYWKKLPSGSVLFLNSPTNLWPLLTFKHSEEEPVRTWVWYFLSMSGCCLAWCVCAFSSKWCFLWTPVNLSISAVMLYCPPSSARHVYVCDWKTEKHPAGHLVRYSYLKSLTHSRFKVIIIIWHKIVWPNDVPLCYC